MRLLVIDGDGIGPEVMPPALETLERLAPDVEIVRGQAGRGALDDHGQPLAPTTRALIEDDRVDGILFAATETRPGEESAVLALREAASARASLRPARSLPNAENPVDVTVLRELTEGLYAQNETRNDGEATAMRPITREATLAFARIALPLAEARPGPTIVAHKATILPKTDGLFLDTLRAQANRHGAPLEERLVDALAHNLAQDATGPLTILAPNLYGDILSDVTAGLAGGLGLAPSLTLGDGPPIAEPVHGTAPDIAGTHQANPTAMLRSLALILHELDRSPQARALERSLQATLANPHAHPPGMGGDATTRTFTQHVLDALEVPA